METKRFIFRLNPELVEMLKRQAGEKGLTLSAYVRMILTERARLESK